MVVQKQVAYFSYPSKGDKSPFFLRSWWWIPKSLCWCNWGLRLQPQSRNNESTWKRDGILLAVPTLLYALSLRISEGSPVHILCRFPSCMRRVSVCIALCSGDLFISWKNTRVMGIQTHSCQCEGKWINPVYFNWVLEAWFQMTEDSPSTGKPFSQPWFCI